MLSRLINILTPSITPSALLVIGRFGTTIHALHFLRENGSIERFSLTTQSSTFRHGGATEQAGHASRWRWRNCQQLPRRCRDTNL
ncbi:hypothetical protein BDV27DRAFT_133398 [Aspergillus caelatus]|uniref:Uncharacterized protein n=1 Tax=Aspergillus caelatus TaxID=61420 RepID=A0A5N6ZW99_9EURO|nr:uncharacterized protein BDV27DRAFT_133398 [Aspergillus caelatus]KAE8361209.1 hypothetical protein BDV27DRAFT_133398 [Aspergillus caelatus]